MKPSVNKFLLLILPIIAWCYFGLFLTMQLWYPAGVSSESWREHLLHFSVVYVMWLLVFFAYTLFDLTTFRSSSTIITRLLAAMLTNAVIATAYFYFQPELILTPRRFLLVHLAITTIGIALWYAAVQYFLPRIWQRQLYLHGALYEQNLNSEIQKFLAEHNTLGWQFSGQFNPNYIKAYDRTTVLLPTIWPAANTELTDLFRYKHLGVEFLDLNRFYELTQRTIPLSGLNELWFLHSVSYGGHQLFDLAKRLMDILAGLLGTTVTIALWPFIGFAIKANSSGPIYFKQERVGEQGKIFTLYKFRSMSGGATNTWTEVGDARITSVGKWLRRLRLDELPQFYNILKGNMSLVGPRPEQVHIVEQLKAQIPYYDERHMVKPGLTGWSQLHVYANDLESTKQKLQYDLYYIKNRGLLLDIEIVLRTVFYIMTLQGK
jgi:lipopolysaccharide/colanic/teichoic acid biosynthesis glycosyltransferase